ncbi:translation initiation factor IF-6 [Candidatus Woesearchaeota archaeon]|nr:translation initiation factor IF-6 [Candidatus Woesearchaeota archaeon]MCF7901675.1 translation initiation factor IF-6 [Candidatus Woesearchaeota archaeon]MCF8013740.1 translation initiation factor IF-6 [Candidatus Woesearchaeota archaeon]
MNSKIMSFHNNSNIGLYLFVNDRVLLVGKEVPEDCDKDLEKVFNLPVTRLTIAGASFIGVFITGTNDTLLVPNIIFEDELEILKETGLEIKVIDTKQTCLGNNVIIGKDKLFVNNEFSDSQARKLGESLGLDAEKIKIGGVSAIGSLFVFNTETKKGLVGNDIDDEDFEMLQNKLGYELTPTSVNMGSPYVKSGIVVNKNGFIIGKISGGPEINNAEEGLGFLDD